MGRGARLAARTAYEAVDAATASNPEPRTQQSRPAAQPRTATEPEPATTRNPSTRTLNVGSAVQAAGKVHGSVKAAKQGVFAPVKRASHALTLEMTGSFFALFALSFSIAAWRARAGLHDRTDVAHFWVYVVLAVLFGYFAGSNFMRARRL